MNDDLEPTRETDIRVAEAMGWRWLVSPPHGIFAACRTLTRPEAHPGIYTWVWDGDPTIRPDRVPEYSSHIPHYTTDPALVVPMLARIGKLVGGPVDLSPPDPDSAQPPIVWSVGVWRKHLHRGAATANLALCTALLAVWEEMKTNQ